MNVDHLPAPTATINSRQESDYELKFLPVFVLGLMIGAIFTSLFVDVKAKPHAPPALDGDIRAEIARRTRQTVADVNSGKRSRADLKASNIHISENLYADHN